MVWLEIAVTDRASKMENYDYFRGVVHLACLICSSYATAYLTTFSHVVFRVVTITGMPEVDSFSIILYNF